ncbi:hypothetical protein KXW98_002692 [Aspergillus fumigatus]|uniref:Uncharacterized protein n=1 Tax=Aspergillus fumigatus TaxID=746128 RepID=A0A9P8NJ40_ASPFM|nr:hypothetical protein KXX30_001245 [Aspergillus fumigatus]KAH1300428.1 hypothetical protein KXX11_005264 [Aspergillus fumigatus]KAH1320620.1 hypothetical protein KXX38_009319 [Aspergillus fumigatus]KAH1332905.1 hypothetical protein KXX47_002381 [Aspergillus fumigatus]KAH1346710.1 hypothetical protein KXX14_004418 [Aspergillus fumigatus]
MNTPLPPQSCSTNDVSSCMSDHNLPITHHPSSRQQCVVSDQVIDSGIHDAKLHPRSLRNTTCKLHCITPYEWHGRSISLEVLEGTGDSTWPEEIWSSDTPGGHS